MTLQLQLWWCKVVRFIRGIDYEELHRTLHRNSKRKLLLVTCAVILIFYYLGMSKDGEQILHAAHCVKERFANWEQGVFDRSVGVDSSSVSFIGNGHIGVDVNGELRFSSNATGILDFATGFKPFVKLEVIGAHSSGETIFTEFEAGRLRKIKCYVVLQDGDCMCIIRTNYAHRTRRELLVEEVKVINPTTQKIYAVSPKIITTDLYKPNGPSAVPAKYMESKKLLLEFRWIRTYLIRAEHNLWNPKWGCISRVHGFKRKASVTVKMKRPEAKKWTSNKTGEAVVYTQIFPLQASSITSAIMCSNVPTEYTVSQKREETVRFVCIVEQRELSSNMAIDTNPLLQELGGRVVTEFKLLNGMSPHNLDTAHENAWAKLHTATFYLSPSKAPNVLNSDQINATRYILMSNVKAPLLEESTPEDKRKSLELSSRRNERCYSEHSTLLYPSKLWNDWIHVQDLLRKAEIWLLTLEKRGCASLLKAGATGVAQAFTLSLSAASYHDSHLEIALSVSDLHRELAFGGLPIGVGVGKASARVRIDDANTPYFEVSATGPLYACGGGCLGEPVTLGKTPVKIPVKITKPETSILYIATSRRHLEQLRSTIHVSEVISAPAHEEELLALHRHGSAMGGLPTWFWFFLVVVLIAFHAFLAKLLWSEWRKGDMTPYNPYLRNRYTSSRSH